MLNKIVNKRIKGFTILESLVSISILAVAVTGPLVYVTNSFKAAEVARDQTTAFYLAQDAIEHIKNIRDDNGLNTALTRSQWLDGINSSCINTGTPTTKCYFDYANDLTVGSDPEPCPANICPPLRKNGDAETFGGYGYDTSWSESPFTRTIEIVEIETGEEIQVTITIDWQTRGIDRQITVVEHVFNWYKTEEA